MLNTLHPKVRILRAILSCAVVGSLLQSCDERYNLDNIGGDVHLFENGMSAPIGNSDKFYLSDFIEDNEMLVVDNGRYALQYSGHTASDALEIPSFSIDKIDPSISTTHLDFVESLREVPEIATALDAIGYTGGPLPSIPGLLAPDAHAPIADKTEYFDFTIDGIPAEVVNIQSMKPGDDALITLSLHAEGFPTTITHLTFEFVLCPPSQMQVIPVEQDIWKDVDGRYHIEHDLPCIDGKLDDEVHFRLEALNFNPPLERREDGTIYIESELYYAGKIHINEPFDLSGWTPALDLNVGFVSSPTTVSSFVACVQAQVEPFETEQTFNDFPEILADPNICLDLQSVNLMFDINNSTPLSLESTIEMQTLFVDGSLSPLVATEAPIHIDANALQSIILTNDASMAGTQGYIPNLHELVKRVPRSINIKASPYIPPTDVELSVGDSYAVQIDYKMSVPIVFGDEVNLELETVIDGLGGNGDLLSAVSEAVLYADIVSTLPLDLTMEALPCDVNGNVLDEVTIEGLPVIRANSTTSMQLYIHATGSQETLDNLDRIIFTIKGTSENGGELAPTQYMQINNIAIEIPQGIDVVDDINNL